MMLLAAVIAGIVIAGINGITGFHLERWIGKSPPVPVPFSLLCAFFGTVVGGMVIGALLDFLIMPWPLNYIPITIAALIGGFLGICIGTFFAGQ